MTQDDFFIKQSLKLAKKGLSWTNPNPLVGAVIVKNDQILAEGYHHRAGFPHAEIEALNNAVADVKGATLYVNLEPCAHFGKTPPCVDAIIKAGIRRVAFATLDPNQKVMGKGKSILEEAGIATTIINGKLVREARMINETFFTFHQKNRPFIAIKFAASLDGKIATKTHDSQWITNNQARLFARRLRDNYQAILLGINTALRDDPHLGARAKGKKDPTRIILDSTLQISLSSNVLRDTNVIIATTRPDTKRQKLLEERGITILSFEGKNIPLKPLLTELAKREIISVLVEGGSKILGSFVDEKLVDKVYAFHAPLLIGGKNAVTTIGGEGTATIKEALKLRDIRFKRLGDNLLTIGYTATAKTSR